MTTTELISEYKQFLNLSPEMDKHQAKIFLKECQEKEAQLIRSLFTDLPNLFELRISRYWSRRMFSINQPNQPIHALNLNSNETKSLFVELNFKQTEVDLIASVLPFLNSYYHGKEPSFTFRREDFTN